MVDKTILIWNACWQPQMSLLQDEIPYRLYTIFPDVTVNFPMEAENDKKF